MERGLHYLRYRLEISVNGKLALINAIYLPTCRHYINSVEENVRLQQRSCHISMSSFKQFRLLVSGSEMPRVTAFLKVSRGGGRIL